MLVAHAGLSPFTSIAIPNTVKLLPVEHALDKAVYRENAVEFLRKLHLLVYYFNRYVKAVGCLNHVTILWI